MCARVHPEKFFVKAYCRVVLDQDRLRGSDLRKCPEIACEGRAGMPGRWARSTGLTGPVLQDRYILSGIPVSRSQRVSLTPDGKCGCQALCSKIFCGAGWLSRPEQALSSILHCEALRLVKLDGSYTYLCLIVDHATKGSTKPHDQRSWG